VIEQGADALGTPLVPANAAIDARGIWGRVEGAHNRFEANRSTTAMKQQVNTLILQAGVDGQLYENETGTLIGGITGQYGKARGAVVSALSDGKIDTQGWGLGGTLTWYGDNGFYADTQAQAMWYDSDLNYINDNKTLINGNKGFGYGLSLEAGKRIDLDASWSLTPQAQLVWSSVKFDTFEDAWGASVTSRNGDSLNARLGLSADYRTAWRDGNGMITRANLYGIANLYQEFMSGNKATVADVDFNNENNKTWGGIGAGGTYAWADDKYALYGEGSLNTSLSNFVKSYAVKGTIGFRVRW
jgi:outer membrane autotransporter protein